MVTFLPKIYFKIQYFVASKILFKCEEFNPKFLKILQHKIFFVAETLVPETY